jgi:hypothetical protein
MMEGWDGPHTVCRLISASGRVGIEVQRRRGQLVIGCYRLGDTTGECLATDVFEADAVAELQRLVLHRGS